MVGDAEVNDRAPPSTRANALPSMFLQSSNSRPPSSQGHHSAQPLLRARSRSPETVETLFSTDDRDFGLNAAVDTDVETNSRLRGHTVRFEDSVQVIAPALRSTQASREAGENHFDDEKLPLLILPRCRI